MARGSREANVEIGARSRKLDAGLRRARGKLQRFGKNSSRDLKKSFTGVGRGLSQIAGLGGAAGLAMAARDVMGFEKRLTRLQIQSHGSAKATGQLRDQIRSMSGSMGVSSEEILGGAERFVTLTGDVAGARASLETFTKVAVASGASMEDVAGTAAALSQGLEVDPKDMEKAFSILVSQGQAGAIELKDTAALLAKLSSQFKNFGNVGVGGVAEIGAALQVGATAFGGNASETVTGLMAMMTAFGKKADKFESAGINVFDVDENGVKKFRTITDLVADVSKSKLMKDPKALQKAFGSSEAFRVFDALAKGGDEFERIRDLGLESNAIAEDFATFQESSSGKMARAWQQMKNAIAKIFTPARIESFTRAMQRAAKVVAWLADHAIEVGVAFAAWKIAPGIAAAVGSLGSATKSAGQAATQLGVALAAFAGYKAGEYLDEKLGLSSALVGEETRGEAEQLRAAADAEVWRKTGADPSAGFGPGTTLSDKIYALQNPGIDVAGTRDRADQVGSLAGMATRAKERLMRVEVSVDSNSLVQAQAKEARQGGE